MSDINVNISHNKFHFSEITSTCRSTPLDGCSMKQQSTGKKEASLGHIIFTLWFSGLQRLSKWFRFPIIFWHLLYLKKVNSESRHVYSILYLHWCFACRLFFFFVVFLRGRCGVVMWVFFYCRQQLPTQF